MPQRSNRDASPQASDSKSQAVDPLEVRATPRVAMDAPVEIRSSQSRGSLAGRLRDLSIGGACLATPTLIDLASIDRIVIMLPEGPLQVDATGLWQREDPTEQTVYTGVAFDSTDPAIEDQIWHVVLDHGRALAHFLHKHADLAELGIEEAIGLSQTSRRREVAAGNIIYRQGEMGGGEESIFLLLEGRVTLEVRVRNARNVPYASLSPGALLGGFPMVARVPNPDTAICDTECLLLEIDREAYRYLRTAKPWTGLQLAAAVLRVSSTRLATMIGAVGAAR